MSDHPRALERDHPHDEGAAGWQPPVVMPTPSAAFLLMTLGRRVEARVAEELAAHGLTLRHLSALGHLAAEPNLSYSELSRRSGVTPQSMHATIDGLIRLGIVELASDGSQGKRAQLRVTARGMAALVATRATIRTLDDELFAALPDRRRADLTTDLLAVFTKAVGE